MDEHETTAELAYQEFNRAIAQYEHKDYKPASLEQAYQDYRTTMKAYGFCPAIYEVWFNMYGEYFTKRCTNEA